MKIREKIVKSYCDFFDKKIEESTLVVAMIGVMIFLAGFISEGHASYKSNILEYNTYSNQNNIVFIDGKRYKMVFQELK